MDAKVAAAAVEPEAKAVVAAAVAAGRVLDFGNETAVAAAAQELAPDLANGIPLFTRGTSASREPTVKYLRTYLRTYL